jgi:tryptophan synthase alpha chain
MNRIKALFEAKPNNILSVFFTAGFPELNHTVTILEQLQASGVDMVEIGMPYSDPVADGPVIQHSSEVSLKNGMSIKTLFEQLAGIRQRISMPLVLMGYLNPVLKFGVEAFLQKCQETGIDGLIIPDLPLHEYEANYKAQFEAAGLQNIFLITPQTPEARIRKIDQINSGFIYMVASAGTTGAKAGISAQQIEYFTRIAGMNLATPRVIGFGISNAETFATACQYANGAIVGSAFVRALQTPAGDLRTAIPQFIGTLR